MDNHCKDFTDLLEKDRIYWTSYSVLLLLPSDNPEII